MMMFIKSALPTVIFILISNFSQASDQQSYKEFGQNLANGNKQNIDGFIANPELAGMEDKSGDLPGKAMPIDQAEMHGNTAREHEIGENERSECLASRCQVGHAFSTKATLKRSDKIDEVGFRRNEEGEFDNQTAWLDSLLKFSKTAKNEFDYLKGEYKNCPLREERIKTSYQDTCDEYYDHKQSSCMPKHVVEIDPKYNYQCYKKRDIKEKVCTDEITSITCKNGSDCDYGGIEKGSVSSNDVIFNVAPGYFTIGTFGNNYWCGWWQTYDINVTFTLKNIEKIQEFVLEQVKFDDYIQVMINGHTVYVGPDGGDRLEIQTRKSNHPFFGDYNVVYNGISERTDVERGTEWHFYPNINLKQYLVEGLNTLSTKLIVGGCGEEWLKIRAKQQCCTEWDIKREEKCEFF